MQLVPKNKSVDKCLLSKNSSVHKAAKFDSNTFLHWDYNLKNNCSILRGMGRKCLCVTLCGNGTVIFAD
jgi:hypothetical protein